MQDTLFEVIRSKGTSARGDIIKRNLHLPFRQAFEVRICIK